LLYGALMRLRVLALLASATLLLGACGEAEPERQSVPAAGENTPPAGTPGVPGGAPYDLDGRGWRRISPAEAERAAGAYIEDNPDRCRNADPAAVAEYVTPSYLYDFPLDIPAADVLAEGCDADRQS
jgi:hypothetical protein